MLLEQAPPYLVMYLPLVIMDMLELEARLYFSFLLHFILNEIMCGNRSLDSSPIQ